MTEPVGHIPQPSDICSACGRGLVHVIPSLDPQAVPPSEGTTCIGHCGSLDWTLREYGAITHKHTCPRRTTTFCQSHRDGCPAVPPSEGTTVTAESLFTALNSEAITPGDTCRFDEHHDKAFADALYAALSPVPESDPRFVRCPLCGDPELKEDIVGGVCLTCADGIAFAQNARRGAIVVTTD